MNLTKRIKIIDSLRGLAALVVVEHHLFSLNTEELKSSTNPFIFNILSWLSEKNVAAVLFFFIVSGFSIGLSLAKNPIVDKASINEYLYRRAKRILPIYWLAIAITLIALLIFPAIYNPSFSFYNLLGNLLFLQTPNINEPWFIPYGNNGPLWSLSYEVYFYLLAIPVLVYQRRFKIKSHYLLLFALGVSLAMILINQKFPNPFASFLVLFPVWLIGLELSRLYLKNNPDIFFLLVLASSYGVLALSNYIYFKSSSIEVLNLGISISLFSALASALYQLKSLKKYLNSLIHFINLIFYKIGLASFSIYIFHYILLKLLKQFQFPIFVQSIALFFLILACYIFENWIVKKSFCFFKRRYV